MKATLEFNLPEDKEEMFAVREKLNYFISENNVQI